MTHSRKDSLCLDRKSDVRGIAARAKDSLGGRLKIRFLYQENVRDKLLRIPVVQREPGALNLDHDAMALKERVIVCMKVNRVFNDLLCGNGLRLYERIAEAAAQNLVGDHNVFFQR